MIWEKAMAEEMDPYAAIVFASVRRAACSLLARVSAGNFLS